MRYKIFIIDFLPGTGYTETSKMLSETALTLLANPGKLPVKDGVLTPAGALGNLLIEKLQSKGIRFVVVG